MKQLSTEIVIHAKPAVIWNILMDLDSYPSWNPFIRKIAGTMTQGENIEVTIHPPSQKPMTFKPTILVRKESKEFRWLGHLLFRGLFDGEHAFKLEEINSTSTRFCHSEQFTGIFSSLLFAMIKKNTLSGFETMNEALKDRAENQSK